MGKIRYAYDTAGGGETQDKPDTGLAVDPAECDQGQEIRDDVVNPRGGPGGPGLEPEAGAERRFYVYYLRRPDKVDQFEPDKGQPFYVGKGCNCRVKEHRKEAEKLLHKPGRKSIKITIVHKLWKQDLDFEEDIYLNNLSEEDAFALEIGAIEQYGRINLDTGCLANMTNGGEGSIGLSDETIERMRQKAIGRHPTLETREKISQANLGKKRSQEFIENLRQINSGQGNPNFGKKHNPESIERMRQSSLKENLSEETIERMRQARLGKKNSPESNEKRSQTLLGKKHSPERIKKNSQGHLGKISGMKGKHHSLEAKERLRQANLGHIVTDETKEKISKKRKWNFRLKRWDRIIADFIKRITKSDTNRRLAY